jgi:hypothetical protein
LFFLNITIFTLCTDSTLQFLSNEYSGLNAG